MNYQEEKRNPSPENRDTTRDEETIARKTRPLQSVAVTPDTEQPNWNDEERSYYRRYLRTQKAIVFITLGGVAIALYTLRSLNQNVVAQIEAANAAKQANVIAQQALETEDRAYISIENAEVKGFPATPHFSCILRNTGHRPATRIALIPSFGWGPPWKGKGPRPIARGDFFPPAEEDAGDILAPSETKPFDYEVKDFMPLSARKKMPAFTRLDMGKVVAGQPALTIPAIVAY